MLLFIPGKFSKHRKFGDKGGGGGRTNKKKKGVLKSREEMVKNRLKADREKSWLRKKSGRGGRGGRGSSGRGGKKK